MWSFTKFDGTMFRPFFVDMTRNVEKSEFKMFLVKFSKTVIFRSYEVLGGTYLDR